MKDKKVLFFVEAVTAAHLLRSLPLAQSLASKYKVFLAVVDPPPSLIENFIEIEFLPLTSKVPTHFFLEALHQGSLPYDESRLRQQMAEDQVIIEQIRPDLVVFDFRLSTCLSAASMVQELPSGIILNIGSGEPTSILSVAKALMSIFGAPDDRLFVSGNFRIGDIRHALADTAFAQRTLGWKAQVSLSEGLSRLVQSTKMGEVQR